MTGKPCLQYQNDSRLNLYIPTDLKEDLREWAQQDERSLNWLVNYVLREAVSQWKDQELVGGRR
mgnify:CR=1 FL=1